MALLASYSAAKEWCARAGPLNKSAKAAAAIAANILIRPSWQ
jgi:hypothetical protein